MNGISYHKKWMHRRSILSKTGWTDTGEIWAFSADRLYSPSTSSTSKYSNTIYRQKPRKVKKSGGSKRGRSWRAWECEPIRGVQLGPGAENLVRGRSPLS